MSVTILQQPGDIMFSKNPVIFRLQALDDDSIPYRAKGARAYLRWLTELAIDDEDAVSWNVTDPNGVTNYAPFVSFIFKDTPTADNHLPADPSGYGSFADYLQAVADAMQANPYVSPYFFAYVVIDGTDKRVWLEARDTDPGWSVAFGGVSAIDGVNMTSFYEAATATTLPATYKILLDVFVEREYGSGTFYPTTLEAIPNTDSEVYFDISGILHREGSLGLDTPPLPVFNSDEPQLANNLRRYYVRYTEIAGESYPSEYLDIKHVLLGGIAQNLFARADFFTNLSATNSLLTWYPDKKTIGLDQPEYLAWYNYTGEVKTIRLELTRYAADNVPDVIGDNTLTATPIEVQPMETLLIPCGWLQLTEWFGLEADTDTVKYTVQVVDGTDMEDLVYLSQTRTFYLDRKYRFETRYLQYLNGFYCPQTLRCTGNFSEAIEVDREESTRILTPDYTEATAAQFQNSEDWQDFFTYRSGFLNGFEKHALEELLIFGKAWEVYTEGFIPLLLKGKKFDIRESRQNLFSLTIECSPALQRRNYSNTMIPIDSSAWLVSEADGYWKLIYGGKWLIA